MVAMALVLAGCQSRLVDTKFRPLDENNQFSLFEYEALGLETDTDVAEKKRIKMLEGWLKNAGYSSNKYEIVDKKIVTTHKRLQTQRIYYKVKVIK